MPSAGGSKLVNMLLFERLGLENSLCVPAMHASHARSEPVFVTFCVMIS
jgi:hypothetical protein